MASVGDSLLYSVLIISAILVTGFFGSFIMFESNAEERGYDIDNGYDIDGCFSQYDNSTGTTQFCKSDFGFLGYNDWIQIEDKQFVKDTLSDMASNGADCIYGIDSFKSTKYETFSIVEYTCNLP